MVEPAGRARVRMVWLGHAGGSAGTCAGALADWPEDWEIVIPDYPGRGWRAGEPRAASLEVMADDVAAIVRALGAGPPSLLFGHSMGGLVAREILVRGGREARETFAALVVSAVCAPSWFAAGRVRVALSDEQIIDRMLAMGGTPRSFLDDPAVRQMVIESVRADLRTIDTYAYAPSAPLDLPIAAFAGAHDAVAPLGDMAAWRDETGRSFDVRSFDGGHFYHLERPREFVEALGETAEAVLGYR